MAKLGFRAAEVLVSSNRKGVVRGLHYQLPNPQAKLAFCIRGEIHDVIADLRKGSPFFGKTMALRLSARAGQGIYIPKGFAHGFQALTEGAQLLYVLDCAQNSRDERGIRFDDPHLAIKWPIKKAIVSKRDRAFPDFASAEKY